MEEQSLVAATNPPRGIPPIWPGAFGAYKFSRAAVAFNFGTLAILYFLNVGANYIIGFLIGFGMGLGGHTSSTGAQMFSVAVVELLGLLVSTLFAIAMIITLMAGVHSYRLSVQEALERSLPYYLKALGLYILFGLVLTLSFLLLIIPFFFVLPRLVLAPYFLIDQDLGPWQSLKASWSHTRGHSWKVWGILGVMFCMMLLAIILVGIYFIIMYSAAIVILYYYVLGKSPTATPIASVTEHA